MSAIARVMSAVAALLLSGAVAAQTFKCTDKAGKTTYSNTTCKELGLKDAGEVPDRINVNPAYQPPPPKPAQPTGPEQRSTPAASSEAPRANTPAAGAPPEPERRCFSVQAGPGKVITRCNDKPDDKDKPGE
jgi:hypothetical protein